MVLESLMSPISAEKRPWKLFLMGLVYSSLAILLSLWIFKEHAALVSVFLTVIAIVPLFYMTMKFEEKKDTELEKETTLLREHSKAVSFFIFLFCGITVSHALWYIFLPQQLLSTVFGVQISTISAINSGATFKFLIFEKIFLNNIKVLTFCILFSLFYGAGALFILTWNASVIATAIGAFIRNNLAHITSGDFMAYLGLFSTGLLKYLFHGIPEVVAYFIAALAGGIISVALIRHDFRTKKFEKILLDSSNLILISIILLFVAAVLEVYVTPNLF